MNSCNITFMSANTTAETLIMLINESQPPFPFNHIYSTRILIAILITLTLISGTYFRMFIIRYLLEPSTKLGPINFLIWVDQINGIFLAVSALGDVAAFVSPFPLSKITGDKFCRWSPLPGQLYVVGTIVWSSTIAFYRFLFLKKQDWLKKYLGETTFLNILLFVGLTLSCLLSYLLAIFNYEGINRRFCTHLSHLDIETLQEIEATTNPDENFIIWRKLVILLISFVGTCLILIEMMSYVVVFHHIFVHDNIIATGILQPKTIKERNHVNAISLLGHFLSWVNQIWFLIIVGFLSTIFDINFVREVSTIIKILDFLIVPLVQITTSQPMRKFWMDIKTQ